MKLADVAETSDIKVGNFVLAIGRTSAKGAATASFGIVNQIGGAWRTWRGDEMARFISLDLWIYLGFSGGALVDASGKVLGVNRSAFGRGSALTIPSGTVNRVVDRILTNGCTFPNTRLNFTSRPCSENSMLIRAPKPLCKRCGAV